MGAHAPSAGGGSLPVAAGASGNVGDVVGVVYQTPGVFVVGGVDKDTPLNGNGAVLTDAFAQWNGNGDGVFWNGNGTDGEQSLQIKTGGGTKSGTLQDKDGNMTVPGAVTSLQPQGLYASGGNEGIGNGASGDLAFAFGSGSALLSLTDTDAPTFVDAGTYAVTARVGVEAFTAGGYAVVTVSAGTTIVGVGVMSLGSVVTVSGAANAAASAALVVRVSNVDGVATRTFDLLSAIIVKLA